MSEEEELLIGLFKFKSVPNMKEPLNNPYAVVTKEDLKIALNLIYRLQKENTELKEKIKEYEIGIVKE